jgi:hypothetical protein
LNKGLFRIPLPLPADAEFTLEVVRDPTTCNLDPDYNSVTDPETGEITRMVSVFRRPQMAANLDFKTTVIPDDDDEEEGGGGDDDEPLPEGVSGI